MCVLLQLDANVTPPSNTWISMWHSSDSLSHVFIISTMKLVIFLGPNKIICTVKIKWLHKQFIVPLRYKRYSRGCFVQLSQPIHLGYRTEITDSAVYLFVILYNTNFWREKIWQTWWTAGDSTSKKSFRLYSLAIMKYVARKYKSVFVLGWNGMNRIIKLFSF